MTRPQRLLPTALLSALLGAGSAAPALAQTYRIVSPDGHITYSDRKPTDPQLRTRELGQAAPPAPLFTPGPAMIDDAKVPAAGRRQADDGLAPPLNAHGKPFPPGLPDAVLGVLEHQFLVQAMQETCARAQPGGTERFQVAVLNWRVRNVAILDKSNRITFNEFTGAQRELLRATARTRLEPLLAPADATESGKAAWCEHLVMEMARQKLELVGDARLAPIANF